MSSVLPPPTSATRISPVLRNMNPNQPPLNNCGGLYQSQSTPDPLDEFLSQLFFDTPDVLTTPTPTSYASAVPSTSASAPAFSPTPHSYFTCHWASRHHPYLVCGAPLSPDPKDICEHFRTAHNIRGKQCAVIGCLWYACQAPPMQRGSLIRHVLTVHLRLLRWQCEVCGRTFSRRGTEHACQGGRGG